VFREKNKSTPRLSEHIFMNATLEMPAPVTKPKAMKPAKRKILLVDDDPAILQILNRLLGEENYLVMTAANGAEAFELLGATKFDLVLLDLNIPAQNEWETFEQISKKDPLLPVILLTTRFNRTFPAALAVGAGVLMEKPLNFVKLFNTIRNLLEESAEARFGEGRIK
jgi:DNA-binding response OmpR family regulator